MEATGINFAVIPQTALRVLTAPNAFFREMKKTGGFVEPLIFMVIMGVISGVLQAVFSIFGSHIASGMATGLSSVIVTPVLTVVFGFVGAAVLFGIWKLLGSQESYETAYRCAAYISVLTPITTLLGLIPYIGSPAGIVLSLFFLVIASIEVHKVPSQKAWLAFGSIGALFIIMNLSAEFSARKSVAEGMKMQQGMEKAAKEMQKQVEEMQRQAEEARKQQGRSRNR